MYLLACFWDMEVNKEPKSNPCGHRKNMLKTSIKNRVHDYTRNPGVMQNFVFNFSKHDSWTLLFLLLVRNLRDECGLSFTKKASSTFFLFNFGSRHKSCICICYNVFRIQYKTHCFHFSVANRDALIWVPLKIPQGKPAQHSRTDQHFTWCAEFFDKYTQFST